MKAVIVALALSSAAAFQASTPSARPATQLSAYVPSGMTTRGRGRRSRPRRRRPRRTRRRRRARLQVPVLRLLRQGAGEGRGHALVRGQPSRCARTNIALKHRALHAARRVLGQLGPLIMGDEHLKMRALELDGKADIKKMTAKDKAYLNAKPDIGIFGRPSTGAAAPRAAYHRRRREEERLQRGRPADVARQGRWLCRPTRAEPEPRRRRAEDQHRAVERRHFGLLSTCDRAHLCVCPTSGARRPDGQRFLSGSTDTPSACGSSSARRRDLRHPRRLHAHANLGGGAWRCPTTSTRSPARETWALQRQRRYRTACHAHGLLM